MYHKPKVSVIIPCYNSADFLEKAVKSTLVQSLNEIEIIMVDDGSTDKTPVLLQQYKMSDNRIEIITHHKNMGLGVARNSAMEKARGEYLFFLDSDDYLHQNALEVLYDKANREDLDILQMQHTLHIEKQRQILPKDLIPFPSAISGIAYYNSGILIEPKACAKLWSNQLLKTHQLKFDTGYYEDVAMVFYAFSIAKRVNNILFSGYHYVQRPNSITQQQISIKHIKDYQAGLIKLQALFMYPELSRSTSSFVASFTMFLVDLSKMAIESKDPDIIKETKSFVTQMTQKYKVYIQSNKRIMWIKKQLISFSPFLYVKLKKILKH